MKAGKILALVVVAFVALTLVATYAGLINVAADDPHFKPVYAFLKIVRDRSVAVRSADLQVPALDDPRMIATGAEHYDAMCADCHRAPDRSESELRIGLYPRPPDLTRHVHASAAEMFWIIKHGIKMSAMPAWGQTHDDASIWSLVAFLQELPELDSGQYKTLVAGESHHPSAHKEHPHLNRGQK